MTDRTLSPIGYAWLARHFGVKTMPHFVESFVAEPGLRLRTEANGRVQQYYPRSSVSPDGVFGNLDFALKREGLHLELLRKVLPLIPSSDLAAYVQATPTGANARRVWYLYERFSGRELPIPDVQMGNYVNLVDEGLYFTGPSSKYRRWRINRNLLHTIHFSPMIRRTAKISSARDADLHDRCKKLAQQVPAEVFQRALHYLYAKETRTSYAIEHETPTQKKQETFIKLLQSASDETVLTEEGLVRIQNAIVDPRFAAAGWRDVQNYVGRTLAPNMEEVHLIPPKPKDLPQLMEAWLNMAQRLAKFRILPSISAAAIVSWLFVYFHPFEDGNGRTHRFLIHHILARRGFGPAGFILPISAVLLNKPREYDDSLECISKPLKDLTQYVLDYEGRMTVESETKDHFRYLDCTPIVEALYAFVERTIEEELPAELQHLQCYDKARQRMREIVELPEVAANLFIKLCLQNDYRLSKGKRKLEHFAKLTETEIEDLEHAVAKAYRRTAATTAPSDVNAAEDESAAD